MFRMLKSFINRRMKIDVDPNDLVLDVGSGDKPHWRADVLLEKFPSKMYANQRSEGGHAVIDRWTILGDVQDMPFRDKAFDYVICSHLLEHVENPNCAIQELERVGKRGYIEVPFEGAQKLIDFPSHLWYVHSEEGTLVFTAKQSQVFDLYIQQLMQTMVDKGIWGKFTSLYFDECIVTKHWQGKIPFEIRGELSERVNHAEMIFPESPLRFTPFRRGARAILFGFMRFVYKNWTSHSEVDIESLLRCRKCGSEEFDAKKVGYFCRSCGELISVLR
ncbi:MAG: class I SAM-dependent methyltransferase [Anaerolineales bacterium]|nr:class I SAM-dependent methyltransferase [Anaerolineales bacterium]